MNLGAFSISLTVKDLHKSIGFYETLGFSTMAGDSSEGWIILKNGAHLIGLFQGMFDKNMLTFNPGWDQSAQNLDTFTDVRSLKAKLTEQGVEIAVDQISSDAGPGSFIIIDPDGNPILIDQHR
ncbi:MAG: VOC family protein [Verrucomicrobiota bacterium]